MALRVINPEASKQRERLLEFMRDESHGPSYTYDEMREAIGMNEGGLTQAFYLCELLSLMKDEGVLTMHRATAPNKYVLPSRAREFSCKHEGQLV